MKATRKKELRNAIKTARKNAEIRRLYADKKLTEFKIYAADNFAHLIGKSKKWLNQLSKNLNY